MVTTWRLSGMSEKHLVYDDRPIAHKMLILHEAAGGSAMAAAGTTKQAIWQGMSLASNSVIRRAPLFPSRRPFAIAETMAFAAVCPRPQMEASRITCATSLINASSVSMPSLRTASRRTKPG